LGAADFPELKFRERFHYDKERENWFKDLSLLAQNSWLSLGFEIN
jgi:hypothetical protein